jgi:hypothetical protein
MLILPQSCDAVADHLVTFVLQRRATVHGAYSLCLRDLVTRHAVSHSSHISQAEVPAPLVTLANTVHHSDVTRF